MKLITKDEYQKLLDAGLIKFSKGNRNFRMTGVGKPAKRHKFYIKESKKIMDFIDDLRSQQKVLNQK